MKPATWHRLCWEARQLAQLTLEKLPHEPVPKAQVVAVPAPVQRIGLCGEEAAMAVQEWWPVTARAWWLPSAAQAGVRQGVLMSVQGALTAAR